MTRHPVAPDCALVPCCESSQQPCCYVRSAQACYVIPARAGIHPALCHSRLRGNGTWCYCREQERQPEYFIRPLIVCQLGDNRRVNLRRQIQVEVVQRVFSGFQAQLPLASCLSRRRSGSPPSPVMLSFENSASASRRFTDGKAKRPRVHSVTARTLPVFGSGN